MNRVKFIGFWKGHGNWPMPVKNSAKFDQTKIINKIKEIQKIGRVINYRGHSGCRLCGKMNGSKEYAIDHYVWPEGYLHYLKDHNVAVDKEFGEYVNKCDLNGKHHTLFDYSYE